MRRKAASVLCYLLTRKSMLAAKEQILDTLWPELEPASAVNSLNQTLYFLRRDIDPAYDDDCSAQYLRLEGDLLWLDPELASSRSARFHEAAVDAFASKSRLIERGVDALGLYSGRFAPEFEYEDWAAAWRDLLHGQFLHLAEAVSSALIHTGRLLDAAEVAVRCLAVEPIAEHVERELIWVYGTLGIRSAAAEQYAHYAEVQRSEFGVEPATLEEIISTPLGKPAY